MTKRVATTTVGLLGPCGVVANAVLVQFLQVL
jgi:hypothetical protein